MSTTLIDIMCEAQAIKSGIDPNPGVCASCGEEKLTRDQDQVCATCVWKRFNGQQGEN